MRTFIFIWLGQLISLIGSWMTGFALDIWVFQQTGSATQYAWLIVAFTVPMIIISPISGAVVDRWNRRLIMILSQCVAGLCTISLVILLAISHLEIWQIYLRNIIISIAGAFYVPAYKASITSLVPQEELARVSSMVQLSFGIQQLISPLLAGVFLSLFYIRGVLLIDLGTLLVSLLPLIFTKFPQVNQITEEKASAQPSSFFQEMIYGWTYLTKLPGLLNFVILTTIYQFLIEFAAVLVYPLFLNLTTPVILGNVTFVAGIATITGSLIMSVQVKVLKNFISLIVGAMLLNGLWIIVIGLRPSILQIAIGASLFFLTAPFVNASVQVVYQKKVDPKVQGRVFSLTGSLLAAAAPLAAIVSGSLADHVFEPLMTFDGPWASNAVGHLIGSGPGRGIGLLFVIVGCCIVVMALVSYQYPSIRKLEENLPNHESFEGESLPNVV